MDQASPITPDSHQDKEDRRVMVQLELPYITDEGLVLIDRRAANIKQRSGQNTLDRTIDEIPMFDTNFIPK
ncbi:MAG TPA: hypothetical protein VIF82_17385 [Burkholderiaceae bacterium]|jgi:hypothetical protein